MSRPGDEYGSVGPPVVAGDDEAGVLEDVWRLVLPGFSSLDDARLAIAGIVDDDDDLDVSAERAAAIVDAVWARRLADQQSWHGLSDADRVEAAFGELAAAGVVARMNFTCCQTCGLAEIGDEVPEGASARGYVFFHEQDAEQLAEPDPSLSLSYGAFPAGEHRPEEYERACVEVGHLVTRALTGNGLEVNWDGRLSQRIEVPHLDWRRRLPG